MASVLYDKLMADMKDAMKAHNMQTVNAVRGVIAKVKDLTVNAGKEITDDVVLAVVAKGVKQREESIAQFESAGRAELAAGEKAELEFLKGYLPAQLSEAEVAEVVKATVAELGATSKKDMGRVMKEVMARVKGQADGKLVSNVAERLQRLHRSVDSPHGDRWQRHAVEGVVFYHRVDCHIFKHYSIPLRERMREGVRADLITGQACGSAEAVGIAAPTHIIFHFTLYIFHLHPWRVRHLQHVGHVARRAHVEDGI